MNTNIILGVLSKGRVPTGSNNHCTGGPVRTRRKIGRTVPYSGGYRGWGWGGGWGVVGVSTFTIRTVGCNSSTARKKTMQGPFAQNFIDGNFAINHGNLDFDWLLSPVTMVVAIDGKVAINGNFNATGPISKIAMLLS